MFDQADNIADIFREGLPYYLLITLPILIICTPNSMVMGSSEFPVQRMSQFDVHGVSYGCRASVLNLDAKSLYTWTTSRHCVVARFQDITIDQFREIRSKAGGLILLLPHNATQLTVDEKQQIYMLEQAMLAQEISIPVYFSAYNENLNRIIDEISDQSRINGNSNRLQNERESALSEIFNSVSANGYQVLVIGASHTPNKQSKIPIIQGELVPTKYIKISDGTNGNFETTTSNIGSKLPLIIITGHLSTFGLVQEQLNNIDVAIFFTLLDVFSKLYNNPNTAPKYRMMFLLSESGTLLNFQGMKKWLDQNLEDNIQIQNAEFVLCIDGFRPDTETMYMHVSKPPKEGSAMNIFFKLAKINAQKYSANRTTLEGVHKKINLADVQLAWEHERFSMKRMPAFTLSTIKNHKDSFRTTIFKPNELESVQIAQMYVKIIAETLAATVFNHVNGEIFTQAMAINDKMVRQWLSVPSMHWNDDVKMAFEKYLKNVKIIHDKPDPREPDFLFYNGHDGDLNVYSVKPAIFDLILTFAIMTYLLAIYLVIKLFPDLYGAICKLSNITKSKTK